MRACVCVCECVCVVAGCSRGHLPACLLFMLGMLFPLRASGGGCDRTDALDGQSGAAAPFRFPPEPPLSFFFPQRV